MNIAIGKIGQEIIFNRESTKAKRSNTNGNVGAYKFFKLLFEKNKHDSFYVIGKNDLSTFVYDYTNVVDCYLKFNNTKIDIGIFMVGISDDEYIINIINQLDFPYILFCDDPRCLDALNMNERLKRLPIKIFGQQNMTYEFKNEYYNIEYFPMEYALAYKEHVSKDTIKTNKLTIIANYCKTYPRHKIISELTKDIDCEIYGRLNPEISYDDRFKGEVEFTKISPLLSHSKFTLLVPIGIDCVTSKYIEAILNNTYPLFYKSYGTKYLPFKNCSIIDTKETLINELNIDDNEYKKRMKMYKKFILSLISGKKLNKQIKQQIKEVVYKES